MCTDLHHGIISNLIDPYKTGTWIRENFIGIKAVDAFNYSVDNITSLEIFDNGIDAIIMRGTGIFTYNSSQKSFARTIYKIKKRLIKINKAINLKIIEETIYELLSVIKSGGILYAKKENILSEFPMESQIELLDRLVINISDKCIASYNIEEEKFENQGWNPFNVTLICKKK